MAKGGKQPGAGRPTKAAELKTASIAQAAIAGKFGTQEEGFLFLLNSKEPSLIRFVFEHAYGKPRENVEVSGGIIFEFKEPSEYNFPNSEDILSATEDQGSGGEPEGVQPTL